ncbi:MAG: amidohydrolase family protein [Thaumarchaeota archaeon]|nr:amidohydrolase family protein [Nitrososphaerota archaeon]
MSSHADLLIRNGKIVTPLGIVEADVAVSDGRIEGISRSARYDSNEKIDAEGRLVMPGVIDPHVHIYSEGAGRIFEENCRLETPSMITGGVTTAMGFIRGTKPYGPILPAMVRAVGEHSLVDMMFHLVISTGDQFNEIPSYYRNHGIRSFKFYMGPKGVELFPGGYETDDGSLYGVLGTVSSLGKDAVAMIHAENWDLANSLKAQFQKQG